MAGKPLWLAAVDETEHCQAAVEWLAAHVVPPSSQMRVLMVAPAEQWQYAGDHPTPRTVEAAKQVCKSRFPAIQDPEVILASSGSSEAIGQAILDRAQALGAAVLALAPLDRTAAERVLKGSVTDYCLRHSRMPVLVVRGVLGGSSVHKPEA